ncbi:MAG: FGGY family carbohydrate kinase [Rothia sp. (in: high G+C Gram-positive bacteria)]|nr:FGGY family carbohydrate kinase [Rothia sp. (in: high G+C Gram-positive bacteria)]
MASKAFFGLDVGTSSTKAVLTDANGKLLDSETIEHSVSRGERGLVEMDMNIWWEEFCTLFRTLMKRNDVELAGIGVSGMGPCVGITDTDGTPVAPSSLYGVDWRARTEIKELTTEFGESFLLERYDSALTSQAGGPKVAWFASRYPQQFARVVRMFMPASFLVWHLTGEYVLDRHSASQCTPMYDPASLEWDRGMCDRLSGGNLELPRLGWSNELAGETKCRGDLPELPTGIPVIFGTIDAWAEQESVGATGPNHLFLMYGTTLFLIANATDRMRHLSMWGTTGTRPGVRNVAGGLATSGALTNWFRELSGEDDYATLVAEAARIAPGSNGLLALPYFAGERTPIQDPDARGIIVGLTLDHTRGHLYRALLESTAFAVRHNIEVMEESGANIQGITCAGGGVKSPLWPQIISDVTGRAQIVRKHTIGASFGNAFMVAEALDARVSIDEWNPVARTVEPRDLPIYETLYTNYRMLYTATADIQHVLAGMN